MFSRKHNQTVGDQGTAAYTNVPTGAGVNGGTANYPSGQKVSSQKVGYGSEPVKGVDTASYPSSQKVGYGVHDSSVYPNSNVYGGGPNVQQTPVSYGPHGTPVTYGPDGMPVKKSRRMRNWIVGALAVCCCCIAL